MPEAKEYFYVDNPMLFVNSESPDQLRILLQCGKFWYEK